MRTFLGSKSTWIFGVTLAATTLLAACGGSGNAAYGGTTAATATATSVATQQTAIKTGSVMINGQATTALTNGAGMTLYYLTSDTTTKLVCAGGCLTAWPPVLSPSGAPQAPSAATGTFAVLTGDATRPQVTYNGHPLYTFAHDSAPGDAKGEGLHFPAGGIWHVATPALAAGSGNGY